MRTVPRSDIEAALIATGTDYNYIYRVRKETGISQWVYFFAKDEQEIIDERCKLLALELFIEKEIDLREKKPVEWWEPRN